MKTIYISSNLVPMWHPNWPEKPEFKGDYFLHYGPQKKYEQEIEQAKKEAVPIDIPGGISGLLEEHDLKPDTFIQVDIGEVELYVEDLGTVTLAKNPTYGKNSVWVEWKGGRTNVDPKSLMARIVPPVDKLILVGQSNDMPMNYNDDPGTLETDNGAMSYTEGMQAGSGIVENWKSRAKAHLSEGKSRCELELFVDKYFGINAVDETHPITTDYGQLVNLLAMFKEEQLDAANKRIAELEEWKRQELELTQPIIGYCQNDENAKRLGIAIGSSIFKRVLEILKEYNGSNNRIKELEDLIQSDSVYTLLRFGSKSPSGSGMDDCEDDSYIDLYNISKELRTIDATKTGNHG
jgi:hypothetical protein